MTPEQLAMRERRLRALARLGNNTAARLADRVAALRELRAARGTPPGVPDKTR